MPETFPRYFFSHEPNFANSQNIEDYSFEIGTDDKPSAAARYTVRHADKEMFDNSIVAWEIMRREQVTRELRGPVTQVDIELLFMNYQKPSPKNAFTN